VHGALAHAVALVAPPACAACRAPLAAAEALVCPACLRALPWLRGSRCRRCALPSHRGRPCPSAAAAFAAAWAPLAYDGTARRLVAALKFRGALPLAGLMGAQVAANLPPWVAAALPEAVVPVPAHAGRRRVRGFDHAALLAEAVARRAGMELAPCLARRDRGGRQVGAGRAQRRRSAPVVEARARPPARVLLVDDVHTTGATLHACAAALRLAGAREVVAVTYARTL
jgi:ComF family protein